MTRQLHVAARVHAYVPDHNAGAETMLHTMLRALAQRGHQVTVWLTFYTPRDEMYYVDGVRVVPARAHPPAHLPAPDVWISHLENVPPTGAMAHGRGIPFAALCHNTFSATARDLERTGPELVVYNSEWMREALTSASGASGRDLVLHPPVVAADYTATPGDRVTLINTNPSKGGEVLRELARRMPDVRFSAVRGSYGDQTDYSDLPNVEELDHVPAHAMRDQVYARTRVLVMPSDYESYGRAGVEAMCSGIPVIAHPTDGLQEALGHAGIFRDRDDTDAWVHALRDLLDRPTVWQQASDAAARRAHELDAEAHEALHGWCAAIENLAIPNNSRRHLCAASN